MSILYASIGSQRRQYDPDARLYLGLVENALGTTATATQRQAISNFIKAEKAASRWDSHKRLYLPIWGNAAANAICMVSRSSGTFVGGVTHGAGFVQGDGSTGYFDTGVNMRTTFGAVIDSVVGSMFCLCHQADSRSDRRAHMGAQNGGDNGIIEQFDGSNSVGIRTFSSRLDVSGPRTGIFHGASLAGRANRFGLRRSSGGVASTVNTSPNSIFAASAELACMARNAAGVRDLHHNGRFGAFGVAVGIDLAGATEQTLNLKTLWETCTGLTLP